MNSSPMAVAVAEAALGLVGVRFRLHGRDPTRGLDCVGVVVAALAAVGRVAHLPARYALRRNDVDVFVAAAEAVGLAPGSGRLEAGDVVVLRPSAVQFHAAIIGRGGDFVHAHAGLGRVVLSPLPLPWPLNHHWRLLNG